MCLDASKKPGGPVSFTGCHDDAGWPAVRTSNGCVMGVICHETLSTWLDPDLNVIRAQPKKSTG
ncbi:hypothetical protein ACFOWZ_46695 [Lentzea rhizosphaerae]|uniref:Uncharacterized protein n=1 Tax=Lentzea rhizosphaerae TaxID=2041025 RepID=A0ABV8CAB3_9PSEU